MFAFHAGCRHEDGMTHSPLLGWINLNKPTGITSAQAVGRVKWFLRQLAGEKVKIGHAGTLDPLASGVLPLAIGEATKSVPYVMADEKGYDFTIRWGQATDTLDAEGAVTGRSDIRPNEADIIAILPEFIGQIQQMPPAFSALKVDGKRAYDLARAGKEVILQPREIEILSLTLVSMDSQDSATFSCRCGKGTYIRSLARDIADRLGTVGHVTMLHRTAVGKFSISKAISLDFFDNPDIKRADLSENLYNSWLNPIESVLDDILAVAVDAKEWEALRHGQAVPTSSQNSDAVAVFLNDQLVSIGTVSNGLLKSKRVIHR